MSKSSDYGGVDDLTLSDCSLYRWLNSQDDGWKELPDDREFARLAYTIKRKRPSHIGRKLRSLLLKRRHYAFRPV